MPSPVRVDSGNYKEQQTHARSSESFFYYLHDIFSVLPDCRIRCRRAVDWGCGRNPYDSRVAVRPKAFRHMAAIYLSISLCEFGSGWKANWRYTYIDDFRFWHHPGCLGPLTP